MATGSGLNPLWLEALDDDASADTLARARERLDALGPDGFCVEWQGHVRGRNTLMRSISAVAASAVGWALS